MKTPLFVVLAAVAFIATGTTTNAADPQGYAPFELAWQVVANNGMAVPDDAAARPFNSFNPPSVNSAGLVVLRGRSRGPEPPASGIFARDMSARSTGLLYRIASRGGLVPSPNNTDATFNEFPSFPRIALRNPIVATRGNSEPVWRYTGSEGEARLGTSGVFVAVDGVNLATAMSQLGVVSGFEQFLVPGVAENVRFDQFPGSPSPTDDGLLLTKGNFSVGGTGRTGIYFRDLFAGDAAVQLIADTSTAIPGLSGPQSGLAFGSTAPPSAARGLVVFVGYDNEESPTYGGVYRARIRSSPPLETVVELGAPVPGVDDANFVRFGEGLSFDGRNVGFWGSWGTATRTVRLHCPVEGNKDRIAYCRNVDPDTNRDTDERWQEKQVPVNQGVFVVDTRSGKVGLVARTDDFFDDFLYWTYSGHPPGSGGGHDDSEPPRWRAGAFVAVAAMGGTDYAVAFKGRTGEPDPDTHVYVDYIDGVYLRRNGGRSPLMTVVDTTLPANVLDAEAPADTFISDVAIEREGFRGTYLAIAASMTGVAEPHGFAGAALEEESTWAGIYVVRVPFAYGR